jgi:serine/threonine-protein kinase
MSRDDADRSLLFGILALQMDFVGRDDLVDAMSAWTMEKTRPLSQVLRERGALAADDAEALEAVVARNLKRHGDDPRRSLATLGSFDAARHELETVADPDLHDSLAFVPVTRPVEEGDPPADRPAPAVEPTSANGRFRVLRFHAKGGLGRVSVALDQELGREVALKEMQEAHADQPASRARFRLEAEVTGGLEHPGIVPVYALGHDPTGRPYYAMRFIRGDNLHEAIKRFHDADAPGRDLGERRVAYRALLGRFVDVCNAVAYAHSRGVLHRDLKPGNVMLGPYGETLVVDWGLAKLIGRGDEPPEGGEERPLQPSAANETGETMAGSQVGTPGYMSPEQAAGRLDELGPASDVYSLGATLYPLLTGRPAFEGRDAGEVMARVARGEFPRPRQANPAVPAALESICLKAMALRPEDRYATPRDLAGDIEHWLADEPVSAHREGRLARLARWSRRHRAWVRAGAAALAVALVAAVALAAQQSRAADRERRIADREREARRLAQARLAQVERGSDLLASIFADLNPRAEQKGSKPLGALLGDRIDRVAGQLEGESVSDPLTVAKLQDTLGLSQIGLGHAESAIALLTRAVRTREARLGADHPETLASRNNLAEAYYAAGRLREAIATYEDVLKRRAARLGPDHPETLSSRNNLAVAYEDAGRLDEALKLHEGTLKLRAARLGPGHSETLASRNNLAATYYAAGRLREATELYEGTLKLAAAQLGPDHPDTLMSRNNLAAVYRATGRLGDAIVLHEGTRRLRSAKLGADHPDTLTTENNLATAYYAAGRLDEAIALFERVLKLRTAKLGADHPDTLASRNNLAVAYESHGRWSEAEPLRRDLLARRRLSDPPDSPTLADGLAGLGFDLFRQEKWSEAEPVLRECLAIRGKGQPDGWPRFVTMSQLGGALLGQGRHADAEPLIVSGYQGLTDREVTLPPAARALQTEAADRVIRLYETWPKPEQAAAWKARLGRLDLPADVFARP